MEKFPRPPHHRARSTYPTGKPGRHGRYRRSVNAAQRAGDANAHAGSGDPPSRRASASARSATSSGRRRVAPWVVVVVCIPVLLIAEVGAYALNVVRHAERAANKIAQPTLPRALRIAAVTNTPPPPNTPAPTNTPDALGTTAPLPPTASPAPTTTVDPIALIHFDRKDPFTLMLIGVDAREGDTAPQSDTIILVYVDPLNKDDTIHLLSIPRDLRVTIAGGFGVGKMADVYALGASRHYLESAGHAGQGGLTLVRDTIELNFRIQLDFFAQVDFNGFQKIIDTIGGVTVDNPYPIKDDAYPTADYQFTRVYFPAGMMHLYGNEALEFARTRHDDNDYARNVRQQQVLLGIRQQGLQLNLLTKATSLIDTLGDAVRTDFPRDQWLPFAKFGTQLPGSALRQYTLTDLIGETTIGGIFYTTINWQEAQARAKEFSPKENKDAIAGQGSRAPVREGAVAAEQGMTGATGSPQSAVLIDASLPGIAASRRRVQ